MKKYEKQGQNPRKQLLRGREKEDDNEVKNPKARITDVEKNRGMCWHNHQPKKDELTE